MLFTINLNGVCIEGVQSPQLQVEAKRHINIAVLMLKDVRDRADKMISVLEGGSTTDQPSSLTEDTCQDKFDAATSVDQQLAYALQIRTALDVTINDLSVASSNLWADYYNTPCP